MRWCVQPGARFKPHHALAALRMREDLHEDRVPLEVEGVARERDLLRHQRQRHLALALPCILCFEIRDGLGAVPGLFLGRRLQGHFGRAWLYGGLRNT